MSNELKIPSITLVKFNDAVGDMIALAKEHPELMTRLVHATKPLHRALVDESITVPLSESNQAKLKKLHENLSARNKDHIDVGKVLTRMLDKELDHLLQHNKHPEDERDFFVPDRFLHPRVGDWWNEMGVSYLTVVDVNNDDDFLVALHKPRLGLMSDLYRINRSWLAAMVLYRPDDKTAVLTAEHFVAWVHRNDKGLHKELAAWYEEHKHAAIDLRDREPPVK